jgi:hypothetical protein
MPPPPRRRPAVIVSSVSVRVRDPLVTSGPHTWPQIDPRIAERRHMQHVLAFSGARSLLVLVGIP